MRTSVHVRAVNQGTGGPVPNISVALAACDTGAPAGTGRTGEIGAFTLTVAPGCYVARVVGYPDWNTLVSAGEVRVTVPPGGSAAAEYRFTGGGGQVSALQIVKRDRITGARLAGAAFEVKVERTGQVLGTFITGADGTTTVRIPNDRLVVTETRAPAGYELDPTPRIVVPHRGDNEIVVDDTPLGYTRGRDPGSRTPLRSIPSGAVHRR